MAVLPPDPLYTLSGDMGFIHSMSFLTYERDFSCSLLAATESGFVYLWDLESNRIKYKQHMGESIQAVHSVDKNVVTQEKSGALKSWIVRESAYEMEASAACPGGYCKSLVLDDCLVVPDERSDVGIYDLGLTRLATLKPTDDNLGSAMCFERVAANDTDHLLVGYESGDVVLFDLNMRKECGKLRAKECVTSIGFDGVARRGVVGTAAADLEVIGIDQNLKIVKKAEIGSTNEGCGVVKVRPDRKILACGGWDGKLKLFSWKTLRTLVVLVEHKKGVTDIQFSPYVVDYWGSKVMAACSGDGTITLWNLYN